MAGLETLQECDNKVKITLKRDIANIAQHLQKKEMISPAQYGAATDPAGGSLANRTQTLFLDLQNSVQMDDDNYKKFVDYLRLNPRKHSDIVAILDTEYAKHATN